MQNSLGTMSGRLKMKDLENVMVAELFVTGDSVPDSWRRAAECFGLEIDPCRRLIE